MDYRKEEKKVGGLYWIVALKNECELAVNCGGAGFKFTK